MAVIHIDGTTVEVDSADNLLQACLSLGIDVDGAVSYRLPVGEEEIDLSPFLGAAIRTRITCSAAASSTTIAAIPT